ncbi:MAG: amidohydrolase family protein, partial [Trichodesmium sp. St16_bin4-tuft]|nr:amidohydrolase family protein [Trichodesmium sp. St16_bin4-tuft]
MQDYISLSLHCEIADILNAYTKIVQNDKSLTGLKAYSAARPPHSEALAIVIASYLAYETNCVNINLLHLSSQKALVAVLMMQTTFPHINFRREVTVGHLLLDVDTPTGKWAKVNPPIRSRKDVEYLWQAVLNRQIDSIVSDHACCSAEKKASSQDLENIWLAKSGFGGTEYLLSGVFSEGKKRGMSNNHMAELLSWNPAQRYGLLEKGDIAAGYNAELVLFDQKAKVIIYFAPEVAISAKKVKLEQVEAPENSWKLRLLVGKEETSTPTETKVLNGDAVTLTTKSTETTELEVDSFTPTTTSIETTKIENYESTKAERHQASTPPKQNRVSFQQRAPKVEFPLPNPALLAEPSIP